MTLRRSLEIAQDALNMARDNCLDNEDEAMAREYETAEHDLQALLDQKAHIIEGLHDKPLVEACETLIFG